MPEASPDHLKQILESQYSGTARHLQSVPIHESHQGQTVWNGAVQVYELVGSASGATRAYAWSYGLPDGQRQFFTILHGGPITGAREAVRAAVVAERRAKP